MTWLLDSNGLIFRFFFGSGNANGYIKLIEKMKSDKDKVIAIFDYCKNNFRKKILVDYKKHRVYNPTVGDEIKKMYNYCVENNIQILKHDEYEADDLIASYIDVNIDENISIVSTDKDLCQLITNNVKIYNPFKKIFLDDEYVKTTFGVNTNQLALWQALCGDSSDNIPGIKGIGPKTATHIINNMISINSLSEQFPKYDFSQLETMISLTTLKKDIFNNNIIKYSNDNLINNTTCNV
jgi:DNA polymerase-1